MKRTMSRRSHSWWWDSHISPKNSKWLDENLEEMDQAVKQMLKLIEEDGDSFAKKAEMYYKKRPELVAHVEAFYRIYRALAERYDHVTGELRKTIPSDLQSQGSGGSSDFGSESPSPSPSHENRPPRPKQSHRAAGFDFFLGAGHSQKGSDGSSSSSESESDSDNATSKNHLSYTGENGNGEKLHMRIIELENELSGMSEKLQACEGKKLVENENCEMLHMKISKVEEKLLVEKEKNMVLEEEITRLKHELKQKESSILLRDSEFETKPFHEENELVEPELELETNLVRDPELELDRNLARDLQERIATLESEVSSREHTIEELKLEIANGKERFSQEKSQLELEYFALSESRDAELKLEKNLILDLQDQIVKLEAESSDRGSAIEELEATISDATEQFSKDKLQLEGVISGLMKSHEMLEIKFMGLQDEIKQLNAEKSKMWSEIEILKNEKSESCRQVEELNHDFDGVKLKYDTLAAEKDELFAKVQSLVADVSSRDDRIRQMDEHLHRLHVEHMELIKGCQDAQKVSGELSAKVRALEEEVERQRVTISDHAEGKREAIRQLCFSLEHYRDGYEKLRQALHGHKRPTIMAS